MERQGKKLNFSPNAAPGRDSPHRSSCKAWRDTALPLYLLSVSKREAEARLRILPTARMSSSVPPSSNLSITLAAVAVKTRGGLIVQGFKLRAELRLARQESDSI